MTFQVQVGSGGLAGWSLLMRTAKKQQDIVAADGAVRLASDHYRSKIGTVASAEDLISDYRLLKLSLQAFGLHNDIGNKAFIRKILESDLSDSSSLANRLSDKTYRRFAEAFGFGKTSPNTVTSPEFADRMISQYIEQEFENRVGESDESLRIALNARRELPSLAARQASNDTKWYEVLGSIPLRSVFEGAFGFNNAYRKLPIDRQLQEFKSAAERVFGTADMAQFTEADSLEKLIRQYLVRNAAQSSEATNRYSTALALLSGK